MDSILPTDYSGVSALPQLLGRSGYNDVILQMSYVDGAQQLIVDSSIPTVATVRITGYNAEQGIYPEDVSFFYKPIGGTGNEEIPVDILGQPELQDDGSYIVTTRIPPLNFRADGHLVANYSDGSTSDGLDLVQAPYPALPEVLDNDGASREILLDYENLLDVLAPPNARSNTGTVQSSFSRKGLNALENKDDKKRKEAVQGAVQQAVSRIRGLSELLVTHHLGDELVKLQTWLTAIAIPDFTNIDIGDFLADLSDLVEYTAGVTQDIVKLTTILEQYSIGLKGSTTSQNSGVINQAAQAFRYTSNSVFDIEAPTTLLNTEYLIQQSTKATFRQTGVDQLSCFNSWQRAEDGIVRQSKNQYNYATEGIYNGAKVKVGTYMSGTDNYMSGYSLTAGPVPLGSSYNVLAVGDIDFFSVIGSFLVRTFNDMASKVKNFIVKASENVFIQSEENLAIEAKGDTLHLINRKGKIIIDAKQVIFKTDDPVDFYKGKGPLFYPAQPDYAPIKVPRFDLLKLPHLSVIDLMEPGSILAATPAYPLYIVETAFTTLPEPPKTIIPPELLDYPKAAPGATVPQPNNGVISSPVYPAA